MDAPALSPGYVRETILTWAALIVFILCAAVLVLAFVAVGTIAFLIISSNHKHHRPEDAPPPAPAQPKDEEKR